jgi:hypothetical protein
VIDLNKLELYDLKNTNKELIEEKATRIKFRLLKPFDQGHNIVIHIRRSNARTNHFRKLVKRIILMDNRTR